MGLPCWIWHFMLLKWITIMKQLFLNVWLWYHKSSVNKANLRRYFFYLLCLFLHSWISYYFLLCLKNIACLLILPKFLYHWCQDDRINYLGGGEDNGSIQPGQGYFVKWNRFFIGLFSESQDQVNKSFSDLVIPITHHYSDILKKLHIGTYSEISKLILK